MTQSVERLLKWLPAALVVSTLIGAGYVAQFQINAQAEQLKDVQKDVEENEDDVEQLQRLLIEQQGQNRLEVQELKGDIKLILRLLQENRGQ